MMQGYWSAQRVCRLVAVLVAGYHGVGFLVGIVIGVVLRPWIASLNAKTVMVDGGVPGHYFTYMDAEETRVFSDAMVTLTITTVLWLIAALVLYKASRKLGAMIEGAHGKGRRMRATTRLEQA